MGHNGKRRAGGHQLTVGALLLGVTVAVAACSGGSGKKSVSLDISHGAPAGITAGSTDSATTLPATGPASGGASPAAGGVTTTNGHPGTTARTTSGGGTGTTAPAMTSPKTTTPVSAGPAPVTPGTYVYKTSGTSTVTSGSTSTPISVPSPSTLKVTSAGGGTQQWVSPNATTTVLFNSSGVFLLSENVPLAGTTCVFNAPVASPPWPVAVGKAFSGTATCGQGQSAGTLVLHGNVTGTAVVAVAGASVATFVVTSTTTLSGTTLVVKETDWYSPEFRLPVQTTVSVRGGIAGYTIRSDTVSVLTSSRPS